MTPDSFVQSDSPPPINEARQSKSILLQLSPTVSTSLDINKSRSDPNSLTRRTHTTFQDVANTELPSNDPSCIRSAQVVEPGVAGNDREIRASGKIRDDLFCHANREMRLSAGDCEGKNRNRSSVRGGDGRCTPANASTSDLAHIGHEANASARKRLEQSLLLAVVADSCAHGADSAAQGRVRDNPALPNLGNKLVPADHTITVPQQVVQQIEDLRFDR